MTEPQLVPTCPPPERIAAFLERRLPVDESTSIESHLIGCDECRRQFADISELLDQPLPEVAAPEAAATDARLSPRRTRGLTFRVATGGVLLLAACLMLLLARPDLNPFRQTAYEQLLALVGSAHGIEGRLADVPAAASVRARGERRESVTRAAIAQLRERVAGERSAENLRALGVAQLVTGAVEAGADTLQDAAAHAPGDARVQNDLAAALLARASTHNRMTDYPKALAAAERAMTLDPDSPAGYFNRALCLSVLRPGPEALEAWTVYLSHDGRSRWADEARRRVRATR